MCLYVKNKETEKLKKRMERNGGWIYLYKIVVYESQDFSPLKLKSYYNNYYWEGGWNKAKGFLDIR